MELRPEDREAIRRPDLKALQLDARPWSQLEDPPEVPFLPPAVLLPLPERLRTSRAVLALRRSLLPEATAVLQSLADGDPASPSPAR